MNFDEIISRRVSIRRFDAGKSLSKDTLDAVMGAASLAPSWKNSQTARYYVVTDRTMFSKLLAALSPRNAENASGAQALVVATYVQNIAGYNREGNPDNELGNGWGIYDSGLSNAYVLLKAAEMGVDSLIMGIRDAAAIKELLDIPENEAVLPVIALGYREADPNRPARKPLDEIVKFV